MQRNSLKLKIAYLYPDILQSFCDEANINVFCKRARARNIDVEVNEILSHNKIQASKYDFYYMGGSNYSNLEEAMRHLEENKNEILSAIDSGVVALLVNCGFILFGNTFQMLNKAQNKGLGVFNMDSVMITKHIYSPAFGTCNFLKKRIVAGFENHNFISNLKGDAIAFLTLKKGTGNNPKDKIKTDGARYKNAIGTYLTSPVLAQNPHFCDFLIARSLRIKYRTKIPLSRLYDDIEWYSHNYILGN